MYFAVGLHARKQNEYKIAIKSQKHIMENKVIERKESIADNFRNY